jgi:phosphoribosylformylglycinamidine cyclo-ligase
MTANPLTYTAAGVDSEKQEQAMPLLTYWIERSFALRPADGRVVLPLGYFANVIDIGNGVGIALSTDGVGTKILVAEMLNKYDTIGIDCVAMNVNDVLCVGAEPMAVLDYIAVQEARPDLLDQVAHGLYLGAELAGVTIPGGEIAQVAEMIQGIHKGSGVDLVGTCIGRVPLDRVISGRDMEEGDVVVGLRSSGVHSNGLTLARRVFFDRAGWAVNRYCDELGRTIGEELLEPTRIYVKEVLAMLRAGLRVKALAHITSTGFLNLTRADSPNGFVLDALPQPLPVFKLIQRLGEVSNEEMFFTYNMGIGFCVVVAPEDSARVQAIASEHGVESHVIGHAVRDDEKRVQVPAYGLVGSNGVFTRIAGAECAFVSELNPALPEN